MLRNTTAHKRTTARVTKPTSLQDALNNKPHKTHKQYPLVDPGWMHPPATISPQTQAAMRNFRLRCRLADLVEGDGDVQ